MLALCQRQKMQAEKSWVARFMSGIKFFLY